MLYLVVVCNQYFDPGSQDSQLTLSLKIAKHLSSPLVQNSYYNNLIKKKLIYYACSTYPYIPDHPPLVGFFPLFPITRVSEIFVLICNVFFFY